MSHHVAEATHPSVSLSDALLAPPPPLPELFRTLTVPQNASHSNRTDLVISKIEDIKASMVETLYGDGDSLSIPYRSRKSPRRPEGALRFPGNSLQEAEKFSQWALYTSISTYLLIIELIVLHPPQPG